MIRCAPWVSWVPSEGPVTLFDDRDGSYHALNPSASAIWRALGDGQQPGEISATVAAAHGAPIGVVQQDVADFVSAALDKGLLVSN